MTAKEARIAIQQLLHVAEDGTIGRLTLEALNHLCELPDTAQWPVESSNPSIDHEVTASSFADPGDIAAFKRCKANGGSDSYCFGKGDNGIGKWGDDTSEGSGPAVALPPEDWAQFGSEARGKLVVLEIGDKQLTCPMKDTMPHKANIRDNAGIDVNYDAAKYFGLQPPFLVAAKWRWA